MESLYKGEEQAMQQREKEIEKLKNDVFKHSQQLFKERQQEANFLTDMAGAQAAAKNMQSTITVYAGRLVGLPRRAMSDRFG